MLGANAEELERAFKFTPSPFWKNTRAAQNQGQPFLLVSDRTCQTSGVHSVSNLNNNFLFAYAYVQTRSCCCFYVDRERQTSKLPTSPVGSTGVTPEHALTDGPTPAAAGVSHTCTRKPARITCLSGASRGTTHHGVVTSCVSLPLEPPECPEAHVTFRPRFAEEALMLLLGETGGCRAGTKARRCDVPSGNMCPTVTCWPMSAALAPHQKL